MKQANENRANIDTMKTNKRTELVGVRVTADEYKRLKFAANVSGKTPSGIAYELLKEKLNG